jgi:hypothetical protein
VKLGVTITERGSAIELVVVATTAFDNPFLAFRGRIHQLRTHLNGIKRRHRRIFAEHVIVGAIDPVERDASAGCRARDSGDTLCWISPPVAYHYRLEIDGGSPISMGRLIHIPNMAGEHWNVSSSIRLASEMERAPFEFVECLKPDGEKCMDITGCVWCCARRGRLAAIRVSHLDATRRVR